MQVSRCYVKLYDVEVANGSHNKECAEQLKSHNWQERFVVVHSRMLVVASCDQSGLILLEYTVLELVVKNPSELESAHPGLVWHQLIYVVSLQICHFLAHGNYPFISIRCCHCLAHISGIRQLSQLDSVRQTSQECDRRVIVMYDKHHAGIPSSVVFEA